MSSNPTNCPSPGKGDNKDALDVRLIQLTPEEQLRVRHSALRRMLLTWWVWLITAIVCAPIAIMVLVCTSVAKMIHHNWGVQFVIKWACLLCVVIVFSTLIRPIERALFALFIRREVSRNEIRDN
jgi:hypothetical protein